MYFKLSIVCTTLVVVVVASTSSAAPIFRDEMTDAAGWGVNIGGSGDVNNTFGYAYNLYGIPEAPNTQVGDAPSRGLKLEANQNTPGNSDFLTLYPIGQSFTGSYRLRFDAWMNFVIGGEGDTEFLGGGIGYDNVTADVASGAQAIVTGEAGSSSDWRAFKDGFFIGHAEMTAGTRNANFVPEAVYYQDFLTAVAPPAVQGQAAGTSVAGAPGFQWITWDISVLGNIVTVDIEKPDKTRLEIVQYDATDTLDGSNGVVTDGNISLFYADFFSSVSSNPALQFGMIDNVEVTQIPEPSTLALACLALVGLVAARRRK